MDDAEDADDAEHAEQSNLLIHARALCMARCPISTLCLLRSGYHVAGGILWWNPTRATRPQRPRRAQRSCREGKREDGVGDAGWRRCFRRCCWQWWRRRHMASSQTATIPMQLRAPLPLTAAYHSSCGAPRSAPPTRIGDLTTRPSLGDKPD